jgi:hypothetical protein
MSISITGFVFYILLLISFLAILSTPAIADTEYVTLHPKDTGAALVNPSMGWTMMFYSNVPTNYGSKLAPSDTVDDFPGLSVVYLRVPWAYIEPEEGHFNWALLDTPAQRWISKGKQIAFRITCSENWMNPATPEWVFKAGAKKVHYDFGKGATPNGSLTDPDFGDPIFLQKLDQFLAAMAARYDNNPHVAFIDIGSFGMWGEGHTMMSSQVSPEQTQEIVKKHIDLYRKRFPHTLLALNDDVNGPQTPGAHLPLADYGLERGITLRDDSILVQPPPNSWYHSELAQEFWPKLPVILEHEHYGGSKDRGAWSGSLLQKAVEDYHASYLSIHWWPHEFLAANRDTIEKINLRLGYRLQLHEINWPKTALIGKPFTVKTVWANAGVAPCYPGGYMALTLKDNQGGIVAVLSDESLNMGSLAVGPPNKAPVLAHSSTFTAGLYAPTTLQGTYDLYISVGSRDGTPQIALPLADGDGERRYKVGSITLK